jgi:hypothetical protein
VDAENDVRHTAEAPSGGAVARRKDASRDEIIGDGFHGKTRHPVL